MKGLYNILSIVRSSKISLAIFKYFLPINTPKGLHENL